MKNGSKDSGFRDISLVLFGMALVKSERESLLAALPPGTLVTEVDRLLSAIRKQDRDTIIDWMTSRGAPVENGNDFRTAMLDAIWDEAERIRVKNTLREIGYSSQLLKGEELARRLRAAADKLDSFAPEALDDSKD